MGTATITVSSGSLSAVAGVVTVSGGAPPIPEIVPTVTFMNGLSTTGITSETAPQPNYNYLEHFDIFYGSQSLAITGTNLDRVVAIQLEYAGPYKYFGDGNSPVYPEWNASRYYDNFGVIIVPSRSSSFVEGLGEYYPQLSFTVVDPQHIFISSASFMSMSYNPNTPPPEGYQAFPSPIHGTNMTGEALDYMLRQAGGNPFGWEGTMYIQDVWWKMRLWYTSGTHFIEPEMYIRFNTGTVPAPGQLAYFNSQVGFDTIDAVYGIYNSMYEIGIHYLDVRTITGVLFDGVPVPERTIANEDPSIEFFGVDATIYMVNQTTPAEITVGLSDNSSIVVTSYPIANSVQWTSVNNELTASIFSISGTNLEFFQGPPDTYANFQRSPGDVMDNTYVNDVTASLNELHFTPAPPYQPGWVLSATGTMADWFVTAWQITGTYPSWLTNSLGDYDPFRIGGFKYIQPEIPMTIFAISANSNYVNGVSATTYLEGYPMWYNGTFLTASAGTPNPPKTGHAAMTFNDAAHVMTTANGGLWDGLGISTIGGGSSWGPWGNDGPGFNPIFWVMKGYAGSTWTGLTTNNRTNWFQGNGFTESNTQLYLDAAVALTDFTASTNYYAVRAIADSTVYSADAGASIFGEYLQWQGVGGFNGVERVLYLVIHGTSPRNFATVTGIKVKDAFANDVAVDGLTFKKLNNKEILLYLPQREYDPGKVRWPASADFANQYGTCLLFEDSAGNWESPQFYTRFPP